MPTTLYRLLLLTLLCAAGASHADPGAAPADDDAEGRTVVRDAPGLDRWARPTSVVDRSQLRDAGSDVPEVLDQQPGLRVTRLGGLGAFSMLSVRGSTGDQVLVFVDGIPLHGAEGGPVDLSTLALGPIDTMAIYRGYAPTILGSSAIGGVLDVRTRRLHDRRFVEVEAGGGSYGTRHARAFYGHGRETWGAGLAVDYGGSEGDFWYLDDAGTSWEAGDDVERRRTNNRFDQATVMAKGRLELGGGVRLTALDLWTWRERGLPGLGLHPSERARLRSWRNLLGLRVEADAGLVQLGAVTFLSYSRTRLSDPLGEIGLLAEATDDQAVVPGVQLNLRAPLSLGALRLTPLVALGYRYERFLPHDTGGAAAGERPSDRHLWSLAAELEAGLASVDTWLVAAARYEGAVSEAHWQPAPGTEASSQRDEVHDGSFRLALEQRSLPDTTLRASVSRGLRFPSLHELFGNTGFVRGSPDLIPETGWGFDLGVTHSAGYLGAGNLWRWELTGFALLAEDLIQLVQSAPHELRAQNVDAALLAGVELGSVLDLLGHLRSRLSLTWLHSENRSAHASRRGRPLPFRPAWKGYLRVEAYTDAGPRFGETAVWLEVEGATGSSLDYANLVHVPARWTLGVGSSIGLWQDRLRLELAVRNVTGNQVQDLAGFPLPGVTAMASLRWTPELPDLESP